MLRVDILTRKDDTNNLEDAKSLSNILTNVEVKEMREYIFISPQFWSEYIWEHDIDSV